MIALVTLTRSFEFLLCSISYILYLCLVEGRRSALSAPLAPCETLYFLLFAPKWPQLLSNFKSFDGQRVDSTRLIALKLMSLQLNSWAGKLDTHRLIHLHINVELPYSQHMDISSIWGQEKILFCSFDIIIISVLVFYSLYLFKSGFWAEVAWVQQSGSGN